MLPKHGGLLKTQIAGPSPRISYSAGLICISDKFAGSADAIGVGAPL